MCTERSVLFLSTGPDRPATACLGWVGLSNPWHWLCAFQRKKWCGGKVANGEWIPLKKNKGHSEKLREGTGFALCTPVIFLSFKGYLLGWKAVGEKKNVTWGFDSVGKLLRSCVYMHPSDVGLPCFCHSYQGYSLDLELVLTTGLCLYPKSGETPMWVMWGNRWY